MSLLRGNKTTFPQGFLVFSSESLVTLFCSNLRLFLKEKIVRRFLRLGNRQICKKQPKPKQRNIKISLRLPLVPLFLRIKTSKFYFKILLLVFPDFACVY